MHTFKIFQPYSRLMNHGFTLKGEGNFKENQPKFESSIKSINIKNLITTYQIHSDQILKIDKKLNNTPNGDAIITNKKNIIIMVKVADCQGILMFDPITKSIGAIHSGWKSSCLNIIGKTVQKMKEEYGVKSKDLIVGIGPSLGPCCCEFNDPKNELPKFIQPFVSDNNHVDFWNLSLKQLTDEGVLEKNIEIAKKCTKCSRNKYYSHRNKDEERMGAFISIL